MPKKENRKTSEVMVSGTYIRLGIILSLTSQSGKSLYVVWVHHTKVY
jgi:hypothetical protein